jgi:hypothetical protein
MVIDSALYQAHFGKLDGPTTPDFPGHSVVNYNHQKPI